MFGNLMSQRFRAVVVGILIATSAIPILPMTEVSACRFLRRWRARHAVCRYVPAYCYCPPVSIAPPTTPGQTLRAAPEELPEREYVPPAGGFPEAINKRVRVLMVLDDADESIGATVETDGDSVKSLISNLLPEEAIERNSPSDGLVVLRSSRKELTSNNVRHAIRRLKIEPTDAVLCYWSSHGSGIPTGEDQLLSLPNDQSDFSRSELMRLATERNPRLAVVLIDACNSIPEPIVQVSKTEFAPEASPTMARLLLRHSGVVGITAAQVGEFAWSSIEGGHFTGAIARTVHQSSDVGLDWASAFARIQELTNEKYLDRKQHFLDNYDRFLAAVSTPEERAGLRETRAAFEGQATQLPLAFHQPLGQPDDPSTAQPSGSRSESNSLARGDIWRHRDGRTVHATLISVNPVEETATFRRMSDGRVFTGSLNALAEHDRARVLTANSPRVSRVH